MLQICLKIWIESDKLRCEIWEKKQKDLKKKEKIVWCSLISERMYFSTWKKKLLISNWHLKSYLQVKDRKISQSK